MNDERDDRRDGDEAVARAYRELATERASATLNERVLRQAAHEAGRGYPRWIGWLRPLAWAATVGLTLAIVIELGDTWAPDGGTVTEMQPEEALPPTASARREAAAGHGKDAPAERSRAAGDAAPASEAFAVDGAPMMEQAADIAAARAGSGSEEHTAAREAPACDDKVRARADTWYQCIVRLRDDGHTETAERELEELKEAFPDFEPPEARSR